jgi:isochorismate pyruvate lyase
MSSDDPLFFLRREIDRIDVQLVALLAQRFAVVDKVIAVKRQSLLPAAIQARVEQVISHAKSVAADQGAPVLTIERIWTLLVEETIAYEAQRGVDSH